MHNILRSYNRKYYYGVFGVKRRLYTKLFRLWLGSKLVRFGFWISPEFKKMFYQTLQSKGSIRVG